MKQIEEMSFLFCKAGFVISLGDTYLSDEGFGTIMEVLKKTPGIKRLDLRVGMADFA